MVATNTPNCGLVLVLIASAKPHAPPRKPRAISPIGEVRAGVCGSLSTTSSTRASSEPTISVNGRLTNASLLPAKCSHPKCAAQDTTSGAVNERKPATQPKRKIRMSAGIILSLQPGVCPLSPLGIQRERFGEFDHLAADAAQH